MITVILWRRRRDYRASKLACTVATKGFFCPRGSSVEETQVAATRKISLHPPPAAVDFSPSRTAKHFKLPSNLSFSATQKGHPKGCPAWRRRRDSNSRTAFDGYTISSRAPSTGLGDFSILSHAAFGQVRRLIYHTTTF